MSLRKITPLQSQAGHDTPPTSRAAPLRPGDTVYPADEPQFDDDMDVLMSPETYLPPEEA